MPSASCCLANFAASAARSASYFWASACFWRRYGSASACLRISASSFALLHLGLLGGQVDHLFLLCNFGVRLGLLDLLAHASLSGSYRRRPRRQRPCRPRLSVWTSPGSARCCVWQWRSGLRFPFRWLPWRQQPSRKDVALSFGLGDGRALLDQLLLLNADGLDDAVVAGPGRRWRPMTSCTLKVTTSRPILARSGRAFSTLMAICLRLVKILVNGHLGDDFTQGCLAARR